jgi:tRNA-dihydrouridine synthase B
MRIGQLELGCGLTLAPMAGFTDAPMRALCRRLGADYTVTEMVSAAALCFSDRKTAPLAAVYPSDAPAAVQLFGHDPAQMEEAAARIASREYPGCITEAVPAAIDLNMGCPVRKIVTSGDGSALMKTPALCADLVRAAVRGASPYGIPVTVKIRAGWDGSSKNAAEVALRCVDAGASAVCVHGRTREQMYAPSADWTVIAAVRDVLPREIPVIGNGDITCAADYRRMKEETGCDGVAIGRETLGNPWIFAEIKADVLGQSFTPPTETERRRTALHLALEVVRRAESLGIPTEAAVRECRGRCAHFIRSMRGAAVMRAAINRAATIAELEESLLQTQ